MTLLAAGTFFYRGLPRWDFGLDNPNKAAILLAFLLLTLLTATLRTRRRWAAWACSALAAAAGYGLVRTFSRGGLVAFLAGALVLLVRFRKELFGGRRWLPMLLAAIVLAGAAAGTGFAGRMRHSLPMADASVGNRLVIWRNVPCMMADAPGGWGRGAAGDAFMCWYQPLDRHERYRTLVNSHFTWLVEHGWTGRFAYVWGWLLALGLGAVRLKAGGDPLPLAVWISFAVAAFFSSVAEEWLVGAVPLATLAPALLTFCRKEAAGARRATVVATLLGSGLILSAFVMLGIVCRPADVAHIRRSPDGTRLVAGAGAPSDWIVYDAATLGGATFGRALRAFAQTPEGEGRSFGVARDLAAVPAPVRRLALCGRAADGGPRGLKRFAQLEEVRILAPGRPGEWLPSPKGAPAVRVFCGDLSSACPAEDIDGLTVVPGAADYLPSWPRLAFTRKENDEQDS